MIWDGLDEQFASLDAEEGRPATATRLMIGLTLLQSLYGLSKWRNRIKSKGMEALLQQTLVVGLDVGAVKQTSLKRVSVVSTVQPKAIAHPTDAKLLKYGLWNNRPINKLDHK